MPDQKRIRDQICAAGERLLTLAFPRRCPICERVLSPEEGLICSKCEGQLPWIRQPYCMKCGCPLESETAEYCADCTRRNHPVRGGRCIFRYEKEMRGSVSRMKFHNRREYLDFYAAAMAAESAAFLARVQPAVILPVPMHPRKRRERGFDQCLLLARRFSAVTQIPVEENNLLRTRYTAAQKGLNLTARSENVRSAFTLADPQRIREPVLLIDDIATTLSTLDEVCGELNRCGLTDVWFLALCTGRNG